VEEFKRRIADTGLFKKLQQEVKTITAELSKSKYGGLPNVDFLQPGLGSPTRQAVKNDPAFRTYLEQHPVKSKPFVDFSNKVVGKKSHRLRFDYPKMEELK
jgi:hypothetical protein